MTDIQDPEIEYSKLGGPFDKDGLKVAVHIFRLQDRSERWSLEVVDHEGAFTVWEETFASDADAAFEQSIVLGGIQTSSEPRH